MYRSTSAKGEPVAVSGVVSVPEGEPPVGGWPVISWGRGTTGMADDCAPSRSLVDQQTGIYTASMDQATADLVDDPPRSAAAARSESPATTSSTQKVVQ